MKRLSIALAMLSLAITLQASEYTASKAFNIDEIDQNLKLDDKQLHHFSHAFQALEHHNDNVFEQHFKELIGYNLQDIHTQKPGINSIQMLIVLNLYHQAQKQLDLISWANNRDNVLKAIDMFEWLSMWASLNEELKEKYAFRKEVIYSVQ